MNKITVALPNTEKEIITPSLIVASTIVLSYYTIVKRADVKFVHTTDEEALNHNIKLNVGLSTNVDDGYFDFRACSGLVEEIWKFYGPELIKAYIENSKDLQLLQKSKNSEYIQDVKEIEEVKAIKDIEELVEVVAKYILDELYEYELGVQPKGKLTLVSAIENLNLCGDLDQRFKVAVNLTRNLLDIQIISCIKRYYIIQDDIKLVHNAIIEQGGHVLFFEEKPVMLFEALNIVDPGMTIAFVLIIRTNLCILYARPDKENYVIPLPEKLDTTFTDIILHKSYAMTSNYKSANSLINFAVKEHAINMQPVIDDKQIIDDEKVIEDDKQIIDDEKVIDDDKQIIDDEKVISANKQYKFMDKCICVAGLGLTLFGGWVIYDKILSGTSAGRTTGG